MTNGQTKQAKIDEKNLENKSADNEKNLVDKVGETNVYPVSEMEGASDNAKVHSEKSFGQGARGAEGFQDSGTSEVIRLDSEKSENEENKND